MALWNRVKSVKIGRVGVTKEEDVHSCSCWREAGFEEAVLTWFVERQQHPRCSTHLSHTLAHTLPPAHTHTIRTNIREMLHCPQPLP